MKFIPSTLPGVMLIEPHVYEDPRGFFFESYNKKKFQEAGISDVFVQDNHSRSVKGTLRGLHTQFKHFQGKLVRVIKGEIFDVAVDMRVGSPTYLKWEGFHLSAENFRQVYIPPGFAHGFYVLSDVAETEYKVTGLYDPADEVGVIWNDPDIAIHWPFDPSSKKPLLSAKDQAAKPISRLK